MERGIEKAAEDGPGVGGSIGRPARVRPLLRFEADFSANQGGTTIDSSLRCKGDFSFCYLTIYTVGRGLGPAAFQKPFLAGASPRPTIVFSL